MVKDPVCGMEIEPDKAADHTQYGGQTYYFCCAAVQGSVRTATRNAIEGEAARASTGLIVPSNSPCGFALGANSKRLIPFSRSASAIAR